MKANLDKLQALAIGKQSFDHKIVFELKGNRIECENDAKLLAVTIDYELKFDKHISDIGEKNISPTKYTKAHWKISKQTWLINYLLFFYFIKPDLLSDHLAFV